MKKPVFLVLLIAGFIPLANGQNYYGIKISQHSTSLPLIGFSKVFHGPFHPGFSAVYDCRLNKNEKHQFRNEINAGMFYHRFFQLGLQLTDIVKYNYAFSARYSAFAGIGGGYMHSFYRYDIFRMNGDGVYAHRSSWKGRPQFTGIFALGAGMGLKKSDPDMIRLSLELRSSVHGTFAKAYVPIVPYNSILLGLCCKIKDRSATKSPAK